MFKLTEGSNILLKILIISPYPPPIGGNTVHVQRLLSLLVDLGHKAKVLDYMGRGNIKEISNIVIALTGSRLTKLLSLIRIARKTTHDTVIHFHVSAFGRFKWIAPLFFILFRLQPKVITIHSGSFIVQTNIPLIRAYVRWLLRWFHEVIVVSEEQRSYLLKLGIDKNHLTVIPAFLPQKPNKQLLPSPICEISLGKTVVLTSGCLTQLYNYEVLIDCIEQFDSEHMKIFIFVFAFYDKSDSVYEKYILERLSKFKNIIVLRDKSPKEFISVLDRCDVYVRTTLKDGDSVAIREALSLKKVVFATDCVERPKQCYLFKQSEKNSLINLFKTLKARGAIKNGLQDTPRVSPNGEKILSLYNKAMLFKK